jgi:hypothetical protein
MIDYENDRRILGMSIGRCVQLVQAGAWTIGGKMWIEVKQMKMMKVS